MTDPYTDSTTSADGRTDGWAARFLDDLDALPVADPPPPGPPILTGQQRQGDVLVVPYPFTVTARQRRTGVQLGDREAVVVVREGHGHLLQAATAAGGTVTAWRYRGAVPNAVLLVEVVAPAHALLVQPAGIDAHDPLAIGPGRYCVLRQMETQVWADPTPHPSPQPRTRSERFVTD